MRIEKLQIDGFGLYRDASFGPFDPALNVITGLNEAGKSTLLAFIRAVLFGFPQRLGAEHYPPLSGGRHGGRVSIVTDAGERFTIERFQGRRGGPVTITAADGSPVVETWRTRLRGGATARIFRSAFTFDLEELQEVAGGEEQDVYGAGTGAAQLPKALDDLSKRASEIFVPRGQNQPVAATLRELEEVESELNQVRSQAGEYGRALARREELDREIERLRGLIAAGERQKATLLRYRNARGDWDALRAAEQRLDELPDLDSFPEDPIERLDHFEEQRLEREAIVRDAVEDLALAKDEAERPITDEALLGHSDEVELLRRGRKSFDESVRDLPLRQADLRAMESQLQADLRQLGAGWDEARLAEFDTSVPRLDEVEQWRQRLVTQRQLLRDREAALERERQEHRDALQEESRARDLLEASPKPDLDADALQERREMLRDVRRRHDEHARARGRLDDLEYQRAEVSRPGQLTPARVRMGVSLLLMLAGLAALAIGVAAGGGVALAVLGGVLVVAAGAVWLQTPDAGRPLRWELDVRIRQAREEEQRARETLRSAAAALELELPEQGLLEAERLDAVETGLETAAGALVEWRSLAARLEETSKKVEERQGRVETAEAGLESAREALQGAEDGWARWLREHHLPDTLTPETVRELFSRIETARAEARRVDEMRGRVAAIGRNIAAYRKLVESLVEPFAPGTRLDDDPALARAADALIDRFDEARKERDKRDARRDAVEGCERDLERAKKRLGDVEHEIQALLAEGGTDDPEELRRRARTYLERQRLESQCRELTAQLRRFCDSGQGFDDLRRALAATTAEQIDAELAAVEAGLEDLIRQRDASVEERGGTAGRLAQLSSDESASRLRAERV
ncbi:MAG: AAA family ATPase, partial [Dehalococcoidia bacterium]